MNPNQSKLLNTAVFLFAGVVLFVILLQWLVAPSYRLGNAEVAEMAQNRSRWVLPHEFAAMMQDGGFETNMLVDLREAVDFRKGTLPSAVNIPFSELMEAKAIKTMRKAEKVLLFSDNEADASAVSLLLHSQGLDNVFVLATGYTFLKTNVLEGLQPENAFNRDEKARFDYNRYFIQETTKADRPAATIPSLPDIKVVTVSGGC